LSFNTLSRNILCINILNACDALKTSNNPWNLDINQMTIMSVRQQSTTLAVGTVASFKSHGKSTTEQGNSIIIIYTSAFRRTACTILCVCSDDTETDDTIIITILHASTHRCKYQTIRTVFPVNCLWSGSENRLSGIRFVYRSSGEMIERERER